MMGGRGEGLAGVVLGAATIGLGLVPFVIWLGELHHWLLVVAGLNLGLVTYLVWDVLRRDRRGRRGRR
jgi:hypothetical protein